MVAEPATVVVCDDDEVCHFALRQAVGDDVDLVSVRNSDDLPGAIDASRPDLVLLDVRLRSEHEGLNILPRLRRRWPALPVVIFSGIGSYEAVVQAMRLGAYDFIPKGTSSKKIRAHVLQALTAVR